MQMRFGNSPGGGSRVCQSNTKMNITEKEIQSLQKLLDGFESKNGSLSGESLHAINLGPCEGCTGRCSYNCTDSCYTYCDGSSGYCWKKWRG